MRASSFRYEIGVVDSAELPRKHVVANMEVWVFNAGTATLASLYKDGDLGVAKTNPISTTQFAIDDGIKFFASLNSLDICIVSAGYGSAWLKAVTSAKKVVAINSDDPRCRYVVGQTVKNAMTDTSLDLPANFRIEDVLCEVFDEDASGTCDWGFISAGESGDENGLVAAETYAAVGFIRPGPTITAGSSETYFASTTRGVLLAAFKAGTDADTDEGMYHEIHHVCNGTIKSIVYTATDHDVTSRFHIFGQHLR